MQPTTTLKENITSSPAGGPISRRMLLAGSAGLVGGAAVTAHHGLAQGTPPPGMPAVQAPVRQDWLDKRHEEIIEPALPIIDPHHHLWDRPNYRYLFPDLLADVGSGHNIRATCYEQAREMYRADGPEELKSLGEAEFVSGVSAMSASGKYGPTRCIADHRLCRFAAGLARQGRARAAHRGFRRPVARHPQRVDLERRPDTQDLHRGRATRIAFGQELSRGMCRPRSAGTCLRRMDVPDAARRSCRSGGRIPADDNRSHSLRRDPRHRPL